MDAGEVVAIGISVVALGIELMRFRGERDRFAATSGRLDRAEAGLSLQREAGFLLELQVALRDLYGLARAHLGPGNGSYATESSLRPALVETRHLAEQAEGDPGTRSLAFVKQCAEVIGWIERGAAEDEKELLRRAVEDSFEAASAAVAARRAELRA